MEMRCIDFERLDEVLTLSPDHPDRVHAAVCPRCRSLLASYQSFLEAEPATGSDLERVRSLLDARIRTDGAKWKLAGVASGPVRSTWRLLLRSAPLLAAAAVVAVAAVVWMSHGPEPTVLRESRPATAPFFLHAAEVRGDGSIVLSWNPSPGADEYQVHLYDSEFHEVFRSVKMGGTSLTLERTTLPVDLPATIDLTWRVYAFTAGDVVATSPPRSIRTR